MTATLPGTTPAAKGGRRGWFWLVLVMLVLVVALAGGRPADTDEPYGPDAVGPSGAKALRELLGAFDADVEVRDRLSPDADVVLVLVDDLTEEQRGDLVAWVEDGGRLVIADPFSPLTPLVVEQVDIDPLAQPFPGEEPRQPEHCTISALDDVATIDPGLVFDYGVGELDQQCFGPRGAAFVVAAPEGRGTQVSLGGGELFTNDLLGDADNAVLAVSLLAPEPGTRVVWLTRDATAPASEGSMWSLVGPGARAGLLQLAIAAGVYVVVRGRRLGRPLHEPQPVQLAGSELVVAVGHLMQQSKDPNRAARLLRDDARRALRERLGLPADTHPDHLAQVVAARFAITPERASRALGDDPIPSEQALIALARDLEALRQEVLHHGHAAEPTG